MTKLECALYYAKQYGLSVFPLGPNKYPAIPKEEGGHGFHDGTTDPEKIRAMWSRYPNANIGIWTKNLFVLDEDNKPEEGKFGREVRQELEAKYGELPETWQVLTPSGGVHYYFKTDDTRLTAQVDFTPEYGAGLDYRSFGGYIVAPPSTNAVGQYEWDAGHLPKETPLAPLPDWLHDLALKFQQNNSTGADGNQAEPYTVPEKVQQGERNTQLHKMACSLAGKGFSIEEILTTLRKSNELRCEPPLEDRELQTIVSSAFTFVSNQRKAEERQQKQAEATGNAEYQGEAKTNISWQFYGPKGKFYHNKLANYLIEHYGIAQINNRLCIHDGDIYTDNMTRLFGYMIQTCPEITERQRTETYRYMQSYFGTPKLETPPPNLIPFKSFIYDMDTGQKLEYGPSYGFTFKFPTDYDPDAQPVQTIDDFINAITCNSEDMKTVLLEGIGQTYYRSNIFRGCIVLVDEKGASGKSTLLQLLTQLYGNDNCSKLSLEDLKEKFRVAALFGVAANIGDDISDRDIAESATFKKAITGQDIQGEYKNKDVFPFRCMAKFFFSCNKMPHFKDKSEALLSRLLLLPMRARFDDPNKRDTSLLHKHWSEEELSYMTKLAVDGLKRLLQQNGFSHCAAADEMMKQYQIENDPVRSFLSEYGNIIGKPSSMVFDDFREWYRKCYGHETTYCKQGLTARINNITGYSTDHRRIAKTDKFDNYFVSYHT